MHQTVSGHLRRRPDSQPASQPASRPAGQPAKQTRARTLTAMQMIDLQNWIPRWQAATVVVVGAAGCLYSCFSIA